MRKDKLINEILGEEIAITPSDLYSIEFKNALVGGYDKAEVDAFLERVGDAFETLLNQKKALQEELENQRHKVDELRDMESTLRNALVSAQKFSQDARDAARREADALLGEARLEKERVRLSYTELPEALRQEISALRAARDRMRADIRAMLATHSALLYEIPQAEKAQEVTLPPFAAQPVEETTAILDEDDDESEDNDEVGDDWQALVGTEDSELEDDEDDDDDMVPLQGFSHIEAPPRWSSEAGDGAFVEDDDDDAAASPSSEDGMDEYESGKYEALDQDDR